VYTLTMHPQVIGRGHRLLILERLVRHLRDRSGVEFVTMAEVANEWQRAHPLTAGLQM
jgi:peptidoglycan-N-acetylglucosamine deacetylase